MHNLILTFATAPRNLILAQLQQLLISLRICCPSPLFDLLPIVIAPDAVVKRADPGCMSACEITTYPGCDGEGFGGLTAEHQACTPLPSLRR